MGNLLFVDGSCDPNSKIGYGAAVLVCEEEGLSPDDIARRIIVRRFEPCSSSSLELMSLLWAFSEWEEQVTGAKVFTDSQTIVRLPSRRASLEASGFRSKSGKRISGEKLYREFYDAYDQHRPTLIKCKGHVRSAEKSNNDWIFSLVDKRARLALRRGIA